MSERLSTTEINPFSETIPQNSEAPEKTTQSVEELSFDVDGLNTETLPDIQELIDNKYTFTDEEIEILKGIYSEQYETDLSFYDELLDTAEKMLKDVEEKQGTEDQINDYLRNTVLSERDLLLATYSDTQLEKEYKKNKEELLEMTTEEFLEYMAQYDSKYESYNNNLKEMVKELTKGTKATNLEEYETYKQEIESTIATINVGIRNTELLQDYLDYNLLELREDYQNFTSESMEIDINKLYEDALLPDANISYTEYCYRNKEVNPLEFLRAVKKAGATTTIIYGITGTNYENVLEISDINPEIEKKYSYLFEKEGKKSADKYLETVEDEINKCLSQKQAQEFLDSLGNHKEVDEKIWNHLKTTGKGLIDGTESFAEGIGSAGEAISSLFGEEASDVYSVNEYETMYILKSLQEDKYGWLDNNYEISQSIGNMLPSITLGMIFTPAVGTFSMGVSAGGNSYHSATVEGYSNGEALVYGVLSGTSEAVLQNYIGKIPGLNEVNVTSLKALAKNTALEGVEEFSQEWIDAGIRAGLFEEDVDVYETLKNSGKSFLYGALIGGMFNTPNLALNKHNVETINTQIENGEINESEIITKIKEQYGEEVEGLSNEQIITEYSREIMNLIKTNQIKVETAKENVEKVTDAMEQAANQLEDTIMNRKLEQTTEEVTEKVSSASESVQQGLTEQAAKKVTASIASTASETINKLKNLKSTKQQPSERLNKIIENNQSLKKTKRYILDDLIELEATIPATAKEGFYKSLENYNLTTKEIRNLKKMVYNDSELFHSVIKNRIITAGENTEGVGIQSTEELRTEYLNYEIEKTIAFSLTDFTKILNLSDPNLAIDKTTPIMYQLYDIVGKDIFLEAYYNGGDLSIIEEKLYEIIPDKEKAHQVFEQFGKIGNRTFGAQGNPYIEIANLELTLLEYYKAKLEQEKEKGVATDILQKEASEFKYAIVSELGLSNTYLSEEYLELNVVFNGILDMFKETESNVIKGTNETKIDSSDLKKIINSLITLNMANSINNDVIMDKISNLSTEEFYQVLEGIKFNGSHDARDLEISSYTKILELIMTKFSIEDKKAIPGEYIDILANLPIVDVWSVKDPNQRRIVNEFEQYRKEITASKVELLEQTTTLPIRNMIGRIGIIDSDSSNYKYYNLIYEIDGKEYQTEAVKQGMMVGLNDFINNKEILQAALEKRLKIKGIIPNIEKSSLVLDIPNGIYEISLEIDGKTQTKFINNKMNEIDLTEIFPNAKNINKESLTLKEVNESSFPNGISYLEKFPIAPQILLQEKYGGNQSDIEDLIKKKIESNYPSNKLLFNKNNLTAIELNKATLLEDIIENYFPDATSMNKVNIAESYASMGCGYMAVANACAIYFGSIENGEQIFKEKFGFDLTTTDGATKSYNIEAIALDIFMYTWKKENQSIDDFVEVSAGGIDKETYLDRFVSYFKEHNIKLDTEVKEILSPKRPGTKQEFIAEILTNPYDFCFIGARAFDLEKLSNTENKNSSDMALSGVKTNGNIKENVGGHAMLVTELTPDLTPIVSSWSEKYKFLTDSLGKHKGIRKHFGDLYVFSFLLEENMAATNTEITSTKDSIEINQSTQDKVLNSQEEIRPISRNSLLQDFAPHLRIEDLISHPIEEQLKIIENANLYSLNSILNNENLDSKVKEKIDERILENQDILCLDIANSKIKQIEDDYREYIYNNEELLEKLKTKNLVRILFDIHKFDLTKAYKELERRIDQGIIAFDQAGVDYYEFGNKFSTLKTAFSHLLEQTMNKITNIAEKEVNQYLPEYLNSVEFGTFFQQLMLAELYKEGKIDEVGETILKELYNENINNLKSFDFSILSTEFTNVFDKEFLKTIGKYPELSTRLSSLKENNEQLFNIFTEIVNQTKEDNSLNNQYTIILSTLTFLANNQEFMKGRNVNNTDINELIDYILLYNMPGNNLKFDFHNNFYSELCKVYDDKFRAAKEAYKDNPSSARFTYSLNDMKEAYLQKYFLISPLQAERIITKYGSHIEEISNRLNDEDGQIVKSVLEYLNKINDMTDPEEIIALYENQQFRLTAEEMLKVEDIVISKYTETYEEKFQKTKQQIEEQLENAEEVIYNGKKIKVINGLKEFSMLVYSSDSGFVEEKELLNNSYISTWKNIDNPRTHGLPTAYFTEKNTGTAPVQGKGVLYGLYDITSKQIYAMGPYDIDSNIADYGFNSRNQQIFISADNMPNNITREYGEFVTSREDTTPSCVIVYTDMSPQLIENAYQAAAEWNIPVVRLNKQEIAKNQMQEVYDSIDKFNTSYNLKYLNQALETYESGRNGFRLNEIKNQPLKIESLKPEINKDLEEIYNQEPISNTIEEYIIYLRQNNASTEEWNNLKNVLYKTKERYQIANTKGTNVLPKTETGIDLDKYIQEINEIQE